MQATREKLNFADSAKYLGCCTRKMSSLAKVITHHLVGNRLYFYKDDLDAYCLNHQIEGRSTPHRTTANSNTFDDYFYRQKIASAGIIPTDEMIKAVKLWHRDEALNPANIIQIFKLLRDTQAKLPNG